MGTCDEALRWLIEPGHPQIPVVRQCELLDLARSTYYYQPQESLEGLYDLVLGRLLDEVYTAHPYYGVRRLTVALRERGHSVGPKRVRRVMRELGLQAIYPRRDLSRRAPENKVYPYLLRDVPVERVNQVWSSDITYIRMRKGFVYLVAVMDWRSRYVLSWEVSTGLDAGFCVSALEKALALGRPEIFNTDQGAQFGCAAFTGRLEGAGVRISMDGRGRALDNVFVERLWRSVKYEEVYLRDYETVPEAVSGLGRYFAFYNRQRPHQALKYRTPEAVWACGQAPKERG